MSDDDALLARFRSGDPAAFDTLYAKYGGRLYGFCFRLCSAAAEAEDLTQEVFVAAFRGLNRFEGRAAVSTYLYKIALYQWRARTGQRLSTVGLCDRDLPAHPANDSNRSDPARISADRAELAEALSTLSEAHRTAFLLVKMEGFTCGEAADLLGIPVGTVKYHVHEAVLRLRKCLNGSDFAPRKGSAHAL